MQGGPGAGQHCKLCNQIAIASNMMGVVEALHYGAAAGLESEDHAEKHRIRGGRQLVSGEPRSADDRRQFRSRILREAHYFIKDMGIALDSARELGFSLPGLELADRLYRSFAALSRPELEAAAERAGRASVEKTVAGKLFSAELTSGAELGTQALFLLYAAGRV